MNIYRFNLRIQNLINQVNDDGEVPTDEILKAIDECNEEIPSRVNDLFRLIRTSEAAQRSLKAEIDYIAKRRLRWELLKDNTRAHLLKTFKLLKIDSFQTDLCRVTVYQGPPSVEVSEGFNAADLDGSEWDFLLRRTIELDKNLVKVQEQTGHGLPPGVKVIPGEDTIRIT